ncbi:MAG: PH domain-containing protein [Actinomycetaceae bacterium]|nr:PH domain-containing protein [Actinomycetaceae bacterium]
MHPTIVIYSRAARYTALFVLVAAASVASWSLWRDGLPATITYLPFVALVALCGWILWGQPRLELNQHGIKARNLVSRVQIPWHAIEDVRADFGLVIDTASGPIRLSAAAPRSALRTLGRNPAPADLPHIDNQAQRVRLDLDTNQALRLVEQLREEHSQETTATLRATAMQQAGVKRTPDPVVVSIAAVLVVWALVGMLR